MSQFIHIAVNGGDCNVYQRIGNSNYSELTHLDVYSLFKGNVTIMKMSTYKRLETIQQTFQNVLISTTIQLGTYEIRNINDCSLFEQDVSLLGIISKNTGRIHKSKHFRNQLKEYSLILTTSFYGINQRV